MRHRLLLFTCAALAASALAAQAQTPAAAGGVADLSGVWRGRPLMSVSMTDTGAKLRGKEDDIPYLPWAREKMLSEIPPTGPFGQPDRTTDPWIRYCEPNGPVRVWAHPGRASFVQLPDRVLILHEVMQQFRIVRLNSTHPPLEDLDPTFWGDSIGRYENNALVIDSIGFNGRIWLDQQGKPTTDRLHLVERFRKIDEKTLGFDVTIDDPGAYTRPFELRRTFERSTIPFMQSPWNCSVRDNLYFTETLLETAAPKR